jgi:hypothetical protein
MPAAGSESDAAMTPQDTQVEKGFGETINTEKKPHLADQHEDQDLSKAEHADYEDKPEQ